MERETLVESVVGVVVVLLFVVVMLALGNAYGGGSLTSTGAYAVIGAIAAFVVVLAAAGYLVGKD